MATKKNLVDLKLQVQVEDDSSGSTKLKNLSYTKIKLNATDEELLTAGNAIAELQTRNLSNVRSIVTGDLMSE